MASLDDIFLTATIDAYEVQDIIVLGVPKTFIQTNIPPKKDGEERVITKITGVLSDMVLVMDSETYSKNVIFENQNKVIHIFVLIEI